MTNIPMNLQFFADGGEVSGEQQSAAERPVNNPANNPAANPATTTVPAIQLSDEFIETMMRAVGKREQSAGNSAKNSVIRSFADQYGFTEQELAEVVRKKQEELASAIPPHAQKQIDAANERANNAMIAAEIKLMCADMGFLDADVAYQLMDKTNVKVGDGGKVSGVKEALEALKTAKPFLATQQQPAAWGQKQGNGGAETGMSRAAQLAKSYNEKKYGKKV